MTGLFVFLLPASQRDMTVKLPETPIYTIVTQFYTNYTQLKVGIEDAKQLPTNIVPIENFRAFKLNN